MKVKLKYPVFVFRKKDNMVYIFYSDKDMKTTNYKIFHAANFKGRIIIDSSGCKYTTKSAHIIKYFGLWGYTLRMQGRILMFDYEYEDETSKVTLAELKDIILNRYPKSRWFYSGWVDVEEFKEEMDKCTTFEEVVRVIDGPPPSSNFFLRMIKGY